MRATRFVAPVVAHLVAMVGIVATCVCGGACGGGGKSDPDLQPPQAWTVGAAGGTKTFAAGPTLSIPAGALASSVDITVEPSTAAIPSGYGKAGQAFDFKPAGLAFLAPITVTLPATGPGSIWWSSANGYDALPGAAPSGGGISAQVAHFSTGFVGTACVADSFCNPPGSPCQTGTLACAGAPTCGNLASSADGTPCTGGVCSGGTCIPAPTPAAAPTFSPAEGAYASALSVSVATSTPGATIHYTTDGSTPTTASAIYTAPISVTIIMTLITIKAIATASGYAPSPVASATYVIRPPVGG